MTIKVLFDSIFKVAISISLSSFLIGCGGGGGGSTASTDTGTTTTTSSETKVTVERGPLLGATVKDANGISATAKSANSNEYIFATPPAYPITATGGYIDVDANGIIDTNDVKFTGVLKSYSTVVTPITTYIATGITADERAAKLAELKAKIGGTVSDDDLLKNVPSKTTADIIVLTNAIYDSYSVLFDTNSSNDDISGLTTTFDNAKAHYSQTVSTNTGKTVKELATLVEENLISTKRISKLTQDDVDKSNNSSSNNNETDQESNSSSSPTVITLPSQFTINNGRLLGSQCAQCHGTNGVSLSGIDSIKGKKNLTHEIYDDDALMNAQANGYTSTEIIAIESWLNNIQ